MSALRSLTLACGAFLAAGACDAADGAMAGTTGRISTGDPTVDLHYQVIGSGSDTVIVLHGGWIHSGYLVPALADLSRDHTLIFYDQRGRGRSSALADSSRITAAADVEDLDVVRRVFGLDRMTIVSHGWGAAIATLYAAEHPGRVRRLLMVGPIIPRSVHAHGLSLLETDSAALARLAAARRAALDSTDPGRFCRELWGFHLSPAHVTDVATIRAGVADGMCDAPIASLQRAEAVRRWIARSLGMWDWRPIAAKVESPVLVVHGRGNPVLAVAGREWAEAFGDGRLVELDGDPQFPWYRSRRAFTRAAREFLAGR